MSQMRIKNFQAETVSEALTMVKKELGSDAVIMKTTPLENGNDPRKPGKRVFQVTACVDDGGLPSSGKSAQRTAHVRSVADESDIRSINECLNDLRKNLRTLILSGRVRVKASEIKDAMVPFYQHLTLKEIDPLLAERILLKLDKGEIDFGDEMLAWEMIGKTLREMIVDPIEIKLFAGKPTRVAVVGPPGAGKSSLVAKLASHFVANKKARVTLVSIDDFKPTATDELERYGRLLNIECMRGEEMVPAAEASGLVLIDSAGIPVGSADEIYLLKEKLEMQGVNETYLVLPAYCRWDDIRRWYDFFKPIGLTAAAMTFVDQASTLGAAINLSAMERIPLSYISKGRTSVTDVMPMDIDRVIRRIVGTVGGIV